MLKAKSVATHTAEPIKDGFTTLNQVSTVGSFLLAAYDEDEAPTGEGKAEKRTVLAALHDIRLEYVRKALLAAE